MINKLFLFLFLFTTPFTRAQQLDTVVLNFKEYLGYIKKYHPIAKQAELKIGEAQANLMKSRGGFDPKIEVDYHLKEFKGTEYYQRFNATFKVPTWYGIEFKANFEQNDGAYLNPSENLPEDGLYSAGVSFSLGQGLWINDRMATLKSAKIFREQNRAERDILVNEVLYNASLAYFDWLQSFREKDIYERFLANAKERYKGVRQNAIAGVVPSIDTLEAKIIVQDRALNLEQAKIILSNKSLLLATFLWTNNNIPIELQPNVIPDIHMERDIDVTLEILGKPLDSIVIEDHPKLKALNYKIESLKIDRRLKSNKLLPTIDLEYNFLTENPDYFNSFGNQQYKGGVNFQLPLFMRKERGNLRLTDFKLQDAQLEATNTSVRIKNNILAIYMELDSFYRQQDLIENMVQDYRLLFFAEERKFSFGESSLFLINSRESKLLEAELKKNIIQNKFSITKAKLFKSLAINPVDL
ncbi:MULTISPECIES: TolC family protein [unclassified Arenibacter]|uniref:TolC family protein n=1 Tax=unclassified Arenibacter TaxID=2615047 RepID=UPI000E34C87E|nr:MULTISPECIES: TolC family protein [unclassified Arenibacter]MCM4162921.1 transporter [Arenibacter sp. A80]RFT56965.1 TolC family protein [Arenibacter sp. P308M17]